MRIISWFLLLFFLTCAPNTYYRGQYSPELEYPEGRGTILFFILENMEYYEPRTNSFQESEMTEQLINRLKLDLSVLFNKYPGLRIMNIDMYQNRSVALDYRIVGIPTVILFNKNGYEIRRWNPEDFERGGGSVDEIGGLIEKMIDFN